MVVDVDVVVVEVVVVEVVVEVVVDVVVVVAMGACVAVRLKADAGTISHW